MGKLFTLDDGTKSTIRDALDDIITEFGKMCRIYYPARWVACTNCLVDPIGRKSRNIWRTGGPMPFAKGTICPMCSSSGGHHAEELSEEIQLKIEWEPKRFWYPVPNVDVRVPYSICQTKGYISDYNKLVQADHLLIQIPIEPHVKTKFRMVGTPISPGNIIQDRYIVATWESRG